MWRSLRIGKDKLDKALRDRVQLIERIACLKSKSRSAVWQTRAGFMVWIRACFCGLKAGIFCFLVAGTDC